jgi:hypothetical protein
VNGHDGRIADWQNMAETGPAAFSVRVAKADIQRDR